MSEIKIISESKKYYTAVIDGKPIVLYKLDVDSIKQNRINDLKKSAEIIPDVLFNQILAFTNDLLENIPNVDEYEKVADEVVVLMELLHKELRPHCLTYLVHQSIKHISPSCYGKANTFTHQIKMFNDMLKEMNEYRKGN